MRVYEVMANSKYGNGLAIVAAPSRLRAFALARAEGRWWGQEATLSARCLRGVTSDRTTADVISINCYQE